MTDDAQREANRLHPNHTFARGKFLDGARWQAAQPRVITEDQDDAVINAVLDTLVNDHEHPGPDVIVDAVYRTLGIKVET